MIVSVMPSVLIVDDDPDFRRLARRLLSSGGVDVINEAGSAAGGRIAAVELRPDAALVDVSLPDGNGIDVARELAALEWAPRIVLTSADADIVGEELDGGIVFVAKQDLPTSRLLRLLDDTDG
jgi:two-component system nitrate/nitrite response regulator NarL